jgi:hypothetical protein
VIDLLLDDAFDLAVEAGDLVVGQSTQQHQNLLLLLSKGELRHFPLTGVGIRSYMLDDGSIGIANGAIKREFEADGMVVQRVQNRAGGLQIVASYA